ncbi:PepSY-associated TM helix domain-containing protein [Eleftheria terrae]|uniref:PepSY-associated TM helix domain-containing protein n=1 Tax=Eleftheria terrae TaxID=1597781 RepID=UPI00263AD55C|nr:PepSY domain-containing protein [Eleftheria terrae]WKB52882.1 PepSY domain-containing protein [Eleftheria terrae]
MMSTSNPSAAAPAPATLAPLLWRLHFWAGLLVAPLLVFAAVTGLLYTASPQLEAWLHADLDRVRVSGPPRSLDDQVNAVLQAYPDQALRFVVPPIEPGQTTQVYLRAPHEHHGGGGGHDHGLPAGTIVYVDPYTAQPVGSLAELQRFKTWTKKLHSSALQGDGWRWLMELAASWLLVMLVTGLYLWWPWRRGGRGWQAVLPRRGHGRRAAWRELHALGGALMSLLLLVIVSTGLTWSRYAGENFRLAQQALDQRTPSAPPGLRSTPPAAPAAPLSLQAIHERARPVAAGVQMQLTPPERPDGVWRIENFDRSQPTRRFSLVLDSYSGAVLFRTGWSDFALLPKATAVGIPFHRGEFGLWNQLVLAGVALGTLFSVVSGLIMWWMRRPRGRLAAPPLQWQQLRAAPWWLALAAVLLGLALPVFGWSLLALATFELLAGLRRHGRPAAATT